MVKKAPKHGPSPAAKLRAALFAKCGQELENAPNIWLVYSARNDRQWVLRSDAEFLHFLYLEFADNVDSFDLAPPAIVLEVNGENRSTSFDAIVNFVDGRKECRELKRSHDQPETDEEALRFAMQRESQIVAAKKMQAEYQRISLADLEPHRHRIQNGLRMLRFIAAAKQVSLREISNSVLARLGAASDGVPLEDLVANLEGGHPAFGYAAAFRLLQQRKLLISIDQGPVTGRTLVRRCA